jgi:hypothetical protein
MYVFTNRGTSSAIPLRDLSLKSGEKITVKIGGAGVSDSIFKLMNTSIYVVYIFKHVYFKFSTLIYIIHYIQGKKIEKKTMSPFTPLAPPGSGPKRGLLAPPPSSGVVSHNTPSSFQMSSPQPVISNSTNIFDNFNINDSKIPKSDPFGDSNIPKSNTNVFDNFSTNNTNILKSDPFGSFNVPKSDPFGNTNIPKSDPFGNSPSFATTTPSDPFGFPVTSNKQQVSKSDPTNLLDF